MKLKEVLQGEFIGKTIKVVDATNKNLIGIKGVIVDETKNLFELDNGKKLVKEQITITMNIEHETITLEGKHIVGRPEERLKKVKSLEH